MNLVSSIKKEYNEFKLCHKNIYNISFHIFCGFIYMSYFFLLFGKYKNIVLGLYLFLLIISINYLYVDVIIGVTLVIMLNLPIYKNTLSNKYIFLLFLLFYFLPDLSHFITGEKTVMNINNINLYTVFVNIFYLLPFSIMCFLSYSS
jgi:hypothetical protein